MLSKLKKLWKNRAGYIAYTRKAIINVTGLVGSLLTLGLVGDPLNKEIATVVAVATAVVHYLVPNGDKPEDEVYPSTA